MDIRHMMASLIQEGLNPATCVPGGCTGTTSSTSPWSTSTSWRHSTSTCRGSKWSSLSGRATILLPHLAMEQFHDWVVLGSLDLVDQHCHGVPDWERNLRALKARGREAEKLPNTMSCWMWSSMADFTGRVDTVTQSTWTLCSLHSGGPSQPICRPLTPSSPRLRALCAAPDCGGDRRTQPEAYSAQQEEARGGVPFCSRN